MTFFPDEHDDNISYLNSLHMFDDENWLSFGFKPRAKDIKTVVEDLKNMGYLKNHPSISTNVVLDGRKVRIGFSGSDLHLFQDEYEEEGEFLENLAILERRKKKDSEESQ